MTKTLHGTQGSDAIGSAVLIGSVFAIGLALPQLLRRRPVLAARPPHQHDYGAWTPWRKRAVNFDRYEDYKSTTYVRHRFCRCERKQVQIKDVVEEN